jgi:hypothetical protein
VGCSICLSGLSNDGVFFSVALEFEWLSLEEIWGGRTFSKYEWPSIVPALCIIVIVEISFEKNIF